MSLKDRISRLEKSRPIDEWKDIVRFQLRWVWDFSPTGTVLQPSERLVEDVYRRQTLNRNYAGRGIIYEESRARMRVTSDPNDNGRKCEPDSELADLVSEVELGGRLQNVPVLGVPEPKRVTHQPGATPTTIADAKCAGGNHKI